MSHFIARLLLSLGGLSAGGMVMRRWSNRRHSPTTYPSPHSHITEPTLPAQVTRRANGDLVLRWQPELTPVTIYIGTHPDSISRRKSIAKVKNRDHIVLSGLAPNTRYYFEVSSKGAKYIVGERVIPMESIPNFRDIGGYPTQDGKYIKWGQVFRSGTLAELSDNDQATLQALGVKLVCDLRGADEATNSPDKLPPDSGITYLATSVSTTDSEASKWEQLKILVLQRHLLSQTLSDVMERAYTVIMIEQNTEVIRTIFERLADADNLPALIHCTAGKDRTGITIALLLLVLGVDKEIVIADYSLSNYFHADFERHVADIMRRLSWFGVAGGKLYPLVIADKERMRRTIDSVIERYGSVENYLRERVGIEDKIISQLKANLLV